MASKIAQDEWDRVKDVILSLRREKISLKGKNGIIERLCREHDFSATYVIAKHPLYLPPTDFLRY